MITCLALLTNVNMWLIISATFCSAFGYYTWFSELPTYLSSVLGLSVQKSGVVSLLPYIIMTATAASGGVIADWLLAVNAWGSSFYNPLPVRQFMYMMAIVPGVVALTAINVGGREMGDDVVVLLVTVSIGFRYCMYWYVPVSIQLSKHIAICIPMSE